jgi:hypothetical protein
MKVTVIFEDNVIVVDGKPATFPAGYLTKVDPNHRVLQWDGDSGYIEVHKGDRVWLDTFDLVLPFVEEHTTQFAKLEQERIDREEKQAALIRKQEEDNAKAEAALLGVSSVTKEDVRVSEAILAEKLAEQTAKE